MFVLESTVMTCKGCDPEIDIPLTLGEAREAVVAYKAARTALRRIASLDDKNVPKYAKQIAEEGLRASSP